MLDFFLYKSVIKDYIPSIYDLFPDFFQESLFDPPDQENTNIDNYTTLDKFNPIKRIADSKYGKIITLIIMILITLYSLYISYKCNGPGRSMYILFALLFPVTHFIIIKIPGIFSKKIGNMICCDFSEINKIETIKQTSANIKGGKYKKKYK